MGRWVFPVDHDCPVVHRFYRMMTEDPMSDCVPSDILRELSEDFERKHLSRCRQCQEYGVENVDLEY